MSICSTLMLPKCYLLSSKNTVPFNISKNNESEFQLTLSCMHIIIKEKEKLCQFVRQKEEKKSDNLTLFDY